MNRFHQIEDGAVITLNKGVYRQGKLYRRDDDLFAAHGSGFIRLFRGGGTSLPNVSWKEIDGASYQVIEGKDLSVKCFAMGNVAEAAE